MKTVTIDNHIWTEYDEGVYEPDEPYVISDVDEWMASDAHMGMALATKEINGVQYAMRLAVDSKHHFAVSVYHKNNMPGWLIFGDTYLPSDCLGVLF